MSAFEDDDDDFITSRSDKTLSTASKKRHSPSTGILIDSSYGVKWKPNEAKDISRADYRDYLMVCNFPILYNVKNSKSI